MKKIIIIALIVIVVGTLICFGIYYFFIPKQVSLPGGTQGSVSFPQADDTVPVQTPKDGSLSVNDFLSDPQTVEDPNNEGHYYLGSHFPLGEVTEPVTPPEYVIEYSASTNLFNVGLFSQPLATARLHAEEQLMQELNITQEQMCSLNYMVSTPTWISETYGGVSLGFSFCPGSVDLP